MGDNIHARLLSQEFTMNLSYCVLVGIARKLLKVSFVIPRKDGPFVVL